MSSGQPWDDRVFGPEMSLCGHDDVSMTSA